MYGDPLERLRKAIKYVNEGDKLIAYDGNNNIVGKINKKTFEVIYSTPSIRLSAGPNTTFLPLGTYTSLKDAKKMLELQEKAQAIPIFEPGRIVGWVDKEGTVSLAKKDQDEHRNFWKIVISFFRKVFNFRKSLS